MKHEDLPERWKQKIRDHLSSVGKPERGQLSAHEFPSGFVARIQFDDNSRAEFYYPLVIEAPEFKEIGVFTEHCGYHIFSMSGTRVTVSKLPARGNHSDSPSGSSSERDIAGELTQVVELAAAKLKLLDEELVGTKADATKWSIKEIMGHLVDSAANNHQRFVRAQEGGELVFPKYDQEHWVRFQNYNESPWAELIELWRLYNLHLARVIAQIPEGRLAVQWWIGSNEPVSLQFLIEDYLVHLQHHLRQIEERTAV